MSIDHICIIPICGSSSRMGNIPKFLLPLPNKNSLLRNHMTNISGKHKSIIVITPDYANMIYNYLKNFFDKKKFEIIITETKNMSETILSVQFNPNKIYSIIMPDTYFDEYILDNMITQTQGEQYPEKTSIFYYALNRDSYDTHIYDLTWKSFKKLFKIKI